MATSEILTTGEREALICAFTVHERPAASSPRPDPIVHTAEPRRRYDRIGCHLPVQLEVGGRLFSATAIDISLGGLRVEAATDAPRRGSACARVRLPAPVKVVELRGEICWSEDGGDGAARGLRFDALRPEDVVALMTYLDLNARNDDPPTLKHAG